MLFIAVDSEFRGDVGQTKKYDILRLSFGIHLVSRHALNAAEVYLNSVDIKSSLLHAFTDIILSVAIFCNGSEKNITRMLLLTLLPLQYIFLQVQ